jgi:hypothetical protein
VGPEAGEEGDDLISGLPVAKHVVVEGAILVLDPPLAEVLGSRADGDKVPGSSPA